MARIDYDAVVKELSKGLEPMDGEMVANVGGKPWQVLSEFRTIGYSTARQTGKTNHVRNLALRSPNTTLVIFTSADMRREFVQRWQLEFGTLPMPFLWTGGFYSEQERRGHSPIISNLNQFDTVLIDDAGRYFSQWSHAKVYKALVDVTTHDPIIHLIG